MIAVVKVAFDTVKADIGAAELEVLTLIVTTGLLCALALALYGPDVGAFELYGMVP